MQNYFLQEFLPPASQKQDRSVSLSPVCALSQYFERTAKIRQTQQLFVHYRGRSQGVALPQQRLSHWLCDNHTSYSAARAQRLRRVRARYTNTLSSSTAHHSWMTVVDICAAAYLSSLCHFIHFYLRVVPESSLSFTRLNIVRSGAFTYMHNILVVALLCGGSDLVLSMAQLLVVLCFVITKL